MSKATEYINDNREKLTLFTTAIGRAHGQHHPEIFDIGDLYKQIDAKVKDAGDSAILSEEFTQLRLLTNNYQAPADTCETAVATYQMLGEADSLYHD